MKTYFVKYLPVEGEIKVGDVFQKDNPADGNFLYEEGWQDPATYPMKCTKVKLFLCSRDIQVGDKLLHSVHGERIFTEDESNKFGAQTYVDKHWYKVIGEISPEAIWMKEGDEFDEDEIHVGIINTMDGRIAKIPPLKDKLLPTNAKIVYLIKGSCGHFH